MNDPGVGRVRIDRIWLPPTQAPSVPNLRPLSTRVFKNRLLYPVWSWNEAFHWVDRLAFPVRTF
jgi:hypothetical protein